MKRGKVFSHRTFFNLQILMDFGVILLGLLLGYLAISGVKGLVIYSFKEIALIATFFFGLIFTIYKPYQCGRKKYSETMLSVLLSMALLHMAMITIGYLFKEAKIPNGIFIASFMISAGFFALQKRVVFNVYMRIHPKERIVIIGNNESSERIATKLIQHMDHLHDTRAILDAHRLDFDRIRTYIDYCDIVYLSEDLGEETRRQVLYHCYEQHKEVYIAPSVALIMGNAGHFTTIDSSSEAMVTSGRN